MLIIGERINTSRNEINEAVERKDANFIKAESGLKWRQGHGSSTSIGNLKAAAALLGKDEYCMDYIRAFREGRLGD